MVTVMNVETGKVGEMRRRVFESPAFNKGQWVEVKPGTKSYVDGGYKPKTADEFKEKNPKKVVSDEPVDIPDENEE